LDLGRSITLNRVVEKSRTERQVDVDIGFTQNTLKIFDCGLINVGESSESIGPPRISVTSVGQTQFLTKVVETVGDVGLHHESGRSGVVVTVGVRTNHCLVTGSIHVLFLWVESEPFRFDVITLTRRGLIVNGFF